MIEFDIDGMMEELADTIDFGSTKGLIKFGYTINNGNGSGDGNYFFIGEHSFGRSYAVGDEGFEW